MDASVFFYTYSTIAQTLASAFGFLVAVVLYRIDRHSKNISIYENRRGSIMKIMQQSPQAAHAYSDQYSSVVKEQQTEGEKITRLKIDLRRSLLWTAATITTSIIMLVLTPLLVWASLYLPWVMVVAVVALALYTIWTYTTLAIEVTK